jgi:hypothetical protein
VVDEVARKLRIMLSNLDQWHDTALAELRKWEVADAEKCGIGRQPGLLLRP